MRQLGTMPLIPSQISKHTHLYSNFCLILITTTDNVRLLMPIAKSRYASNGTGFGPDAKAMTRPISSLNRPKTNRTQAAIVANDLNTRGISDLLVVCIPKTYLTMLCQHLSIASPPLFFTLLLFGSMQANWFALACKSSAKIGHNSDVC